MSLPEDPKGAGAPGAGGASEPDSAIERLLNLFGGGDKPPRLPGPPRDGDDEEEDGMLRMSFLGHLEELRSRLIKCLIGIGVALVGSLCFSSPLWEFVRQPAREVIPLSTSKINNSPSAVSPQSMPTYSNSRRSAMARSAWRCRRAKPWSKLAKKCASSARFCALSTMPALK